MWISGPYSTRISDSVSVRWHPGICPLSSTSGDLSKDEDTAHTPPAPHSHHTSSFLKDGMSELQCRGSLGQISKVCDKELGDFSINHSQILCSLDSSPCRGAETPSPLVFSAHNHQVQKPHYHLCYHQQLCCFPNLHQVL